MNTGLGATSFSFGNPVTTSTTTNLFGATNLATTTAANTAGFFNLAGTATSNPALSSGLTLGFGNIGFSATSALTTNTLGTTTVNSVTTPAKVGLGGINLVESTQPNTTNPTTNFISYENKSIKDSPVEPVIANLINDFMKYIKDQKALRDNIGHRSTSSIDNVSDDIKTMTSSLHRIDAMKHSLSIDVQRLKTTTKKDVMDGEIAHRTHSLPMHQQFENVLPTRYFETLIKSFEERMLTYQREILNVEEYIENLTKNLTISSQEFSQIFLNLSSGIVGLTAQIYTVHESIKELKANYYKFRTEALGENKNLFLTPESTHPLQNLNGNRQNTCTVGPTSFTGGSPRSVLASTPKTDSLFSTPVTSQFASPLFGQSFNASTTTPAAGLSLFASGTFGAPTTSGGLFGASNLGAQNTGAFGASGNTGFGGVFGSPGTGSPFGNAAQKSSTNKRGKIN